MGSGADCQPGESAKEAHSEAYKTALATRAFEIDLFWKRSLFFWGFIASAFIGYAAFKSRSPNLALLIASFGFVCSAAWTLLNRGSKYWQEAWEAKLARLEPEVTGPLFVVEEAEDRRKGIWLRARRLSVSKLAIALSDYTAALWLCLITSEIVRPTLPAHFAAFAEKWGPKAFSIASVVYAIGLIRAARSTPLQSHRESQNTAQLGAGR